MRKKHHGEICNIEFFIKTLLLESEIFDSSARIARFHHETRCYTRGIINFFDAAIRNFADKIFITSLNIPFFLLPMKSNKLGNLSKAIWRTYMIDQSVPLLRDMNTSRA